MRIAIVGAGVSGLTCAHLLHGMHNVIVFEAADTAGGHANTVDVEMGGDVHGVDTGFIVFNDRNYPGFERLLADLDVPTQPSTMSFGVSDGRGFEYNSASANGLFARRTDLRIADLHELTPHYAETLRRWRANVERAEGELHRLGYNERFRRLWRLYLAYCEAGFDEGRIGVVQMLLGKPGWRPSIAAAPARQFRYAPRRAAEPEQPAEPVGAVDDLLG